MTIQNWSEDVVLVDLPAEPNICDEIKSVLRDVRDRGNSVSMSDTVAGDRARWLQPACGVSLPMSP